MMMGNLYSTKVFRQDDQEENDEASEPKKKIFFLSMTFSIVPV